MPQRRILLPGPESTPKRRTVPFCNPMRKPKALTITALREAIHGTIPAIDPGLALINSRSISKPKEEIVQ